MYRIGISGSYGGANLGDEAILQSIVGGIGSMLPVEFTVFSEDSVDTAARHGVERAVSSCGLGRQELVPEIERLDLLLMGGGGILFDHWLGEHLREAQIALEKGIPVMVYAVGVGPIQEPANEGAVRKVLEEARVVTVRDQRSKRALERLGLEREVVVTADPGLLLEPEPLPGDALVREGLEDEGRIVGMSVREPGPAAPDIDVERYHALLASAADYMIDRFNAHVVFVPMEPQVQDVQHAHAVMSKMNRPQQASVLRARYTSGELLSLVGRFSFAVGMRLHFLMFAALQQVPFVALPYASKVMGFIEEMQMESPPLQNLTIGQLLAYIDRSWDRQDALRSLIERGLPALKERAEKNNDLAVSLLAGAPLAVGGDTAS